MVFESRSMHVIWRCHHVLTTPTSSATLSQQTPTHSSQQRCTRTNDHTTTLLHTNQPHYCCYFVNSIVYQRERGSRKKENGFSIGIVAPIARLRIFLIPCFSFNNRHINPGPHDTAINILEHASCLLPTSKQSGLYCDFTMHKHHPLCLTQQHITALHTQRCLASQQQNTST